MLSKDRYAVIGNPIAHSKSPLIHAAFAAQTGQNLEYERILGDNSQFASTVRAFFANGGRGLNVTLPFKELAWQLADERSIRANLVEVANTLAVLPDGRILADNTDGAGLIQDLTSNWHINITGCNILLLGAGGAAQGVVPALLEQQPAQIIIANRTATKAQLLVERILNKITPTIPIQGCGLDALTGQSFKLIINATSAGLWGQIPELPSECVTQTTIIYDMVYANEPTPFMHWGQMHGAKLAIDGLGMLIEQAAESFLLWRGVRPNTKPIMQLLRPN